MVFATKAAKRVVPKYADPETLPFYLTREESAFADALIAANTNEKIIAAFEDHLGKIFARQATAGYAEAAGIPASELPTSRALSRKKPAGMSSRLPITLPTYADQRTPVDFTSTVLKELDIEYIFDQVHDDGIEYARTRGGHLIVRAVPTTRQPIRDDIAWMTGGVTIDRDPMYGGTGTMIRPDNVGDLAVDHEFWTKVSAVPLPTRTMAGLTAARDKMMREAAELERRLGRTTAEVEALVRRARAGYDKGYFDAVTHRSKLIARTETQFAQNFGRYNGWQRAMLDGLIDPDRAGKKWVIGPEVSRKGKRVCRVCRPLSGKVVRINDPFNSSIGPVLVPPLHPACRCTCVLINDLYDAGYGDEVDPYVAPEAASHRLDQVDVPTANLTPGANTYQHAMSTVYGDRVMEVRPGWDRETVANYSVHDHSPYMKQDVNRQLADRIERKMATDPALKQAVRDYGIKVPGETEQQYLRRNIDMMTRNYVDTWAAGSSGTDYRSLLMQRESEKLFGIKSKTFDDYIEWFEKPPPSGWQKGVPQGAGEANRRAAFEALSVDDRREYRQHVRWNEFYNEHRYPWSAIQSEAPFARSFLQSQYDWTQELLTRAGVPPNGKVYLYRGGNWSDMPIGTQAVATHVNPMTSWSWSPEMARQFSRAQREGARIMVAAVPRERILGSAVSGIGCLNEAELIVAFPEGIPIRIVRPVSYGGMSAIFDPWDDMNDGDLSWIFPRLTPIDYPNYTTFFQ